SSNIPAVLVHDLLQDGRYTVEISPTANAPGAFNLKIELVDAVVQSTSVTLPFDVSLQVPEFTTSRQVFDLSAGQTAFFGFRLSGQVSWRVRPEGGTAIAQGVVTNQETRAVALTGPGRFWLETENASGFAFQERVTGERTAWASVVTGPAAGDTSELVDLIADHNGAPVLLRAVATQVGGVWNESISLLRWNGTTLSAVGPELSYQLPCGGSLFLP